MSYKLRECPLCGGREIKPGLRARDYYYGNPGEYTQSECIECSLAFLDPMYDEAELAQFYPQHYYAFSDRFSADQPVSLQSKVWRKLISRESRSRDPKFDQPGRILDIGCGSGWFLSQMRDQGWSVRGVEPNAAAAEFGKKEKGIDIFPGSLLGANFPPRAFDYVRLNHSFEHMGNPNEILSEIHRILDDNGKLMIGVPNRDSFNARVFGRFWHHLALPVHTFTYSVKTLSRMLAKHRFRVERVEFNTNLTPLVESFQMYLNRNDPKLTPAGRFSRSKLAVLLCSGVAHLENLLHTADMIEVTATKEVDGR